MEKRQNITKVERSEISILLDKKYSLRAIARALGRSPNSISYEVRRNSIQGSYDPRKAHHKSRVRKRYRRYQWSKIEANDDLRRYIVEKLEHHWNPDEISGRMRRDQTPFYASKTAIYDWLWSMWGNRYCAYLYSKRWYRRKHPISKTPRVMIPNRVGITKRFTGANHRTRYGHHEEDTMVSGRNGTGALAVMVERKSRLIDARKLPSLSPGVHVRAVGQMTEKVRTMSVTFDNGIENKRHKDLGVPTFFCDPYSSWQKGSVENVNKMIRRYLPKRTDLSAVSQTVIDGIVTMINNKPRKILGYRTALEVATSAGVLLKTKNTATTGCPN